MFFSQETSLAQSNALEFTIDDVLAEDWEIQREPEEFWLSQDINSSDNVRYVFKHKPRHDKDYIVIKVREVIE